jgi:hypothetical protein
MRFGNPDANDERAAMWIRGNKKKRHNAMKYVGTKEMNKILEHDAPVTCDGGERKGLYDLTRADDITVGLRRD